jgi:hypothetical protein
MVNSNERELDSTATMMLEDARAVELDSTSIITDRERKYIFTIEREEQ